MSRNAIIVDAEPPISQMLQDILRLSGIEVIALAKGADAAERLEKEKFDVVFIDLGPSSLAGIELTRKTRSLGFNRMTPIILISGDRGRGVFARGFDAGASFIVHKPIDKAHMTKLVRVAHTSVEQERRRFRRIPLQTKLRLTVGTSHVECLTVDLSLNGALVRGPRTFPLGSKVQMVLYLASAIKPVSGSGSVVRILSDNQMGIMFDGLTLDDSGRLQDYLLPLLISDGAAQVEQVSNASPAR